MADTVPDFSIREVESFYFHLHCIYKGKTKQWSAIIKTAQKICSTRKWRFYNILQKKTRIWVMAETVSDFHIKKGYNFCFDIQCIHRVELRHTEKRSKNLFHSQMKFYNDFQKTYMSEDEICSCPLYWMGQNILLWTRLYP